MKNKMAVITSALLVCFLAVSLVAAQGVGPQALPGSGWSTGIQVQNVGTGVAQIVLRGYDASSSATYDDTTTGANTQPGASVNYVTFPSGVSSFQGSGVLSSDQPIVAIVNANNGSTGGFAAGQYQGTDGTAVDTQVRFPLVKNNFGSKCTTFYVQNAGTAAAKIYASFTSGGVWNSGTNVDPGDMVVIDPAAATPAVPSSAPYALTVTSTEKLAGTVLEHFCATADTLQATRGFVPTDGDTTLLAPIYKMQFGSRTNGLQVQNVSGGAADIYVNYSHAPLSGGSGTYRQWQLGVPAGASVTFFKNTIVAASGGGATGSSGTALVAGSLTAATITSTANIVAINNESYDPVPAGVARNAATTYSALPLHAAGSKIAVPLAKEEFGNKTTGIQIQNAGTGATVVKVTYVLNNPSGASCLGTYTLQNISIPAGQSVTLFRTNTGGSSLPSGSSWVGGTAIKKGCFGGATVEVTSGGPVVAVVQEPDINANAALRQDTKNYEGFKIQ